MQPIAEPTSASREARSRAIRKGAGYAIAARIISVACTLVQVPIALRYLGTEGFGLWITLGSIAGILTAADLGISLGAKTLLAEAYGRDNSAGVRALASETLRHLLLCGGLVAAVGLPLAWWIDWAPVFGVRTPELAAQLPWALAALALLAGIAIPAALGAALAAAVQLTWLVHLSAALGGALTLAVIAAAAVSKSSWLSVVLATLTLPVLINAGLGVLVACRLQGWRGPAPARPALAQRQRLLALGRWFFLPQVGSLFMVMSVPIAIAAVGGPAAAAAYNLLQRVFGLVNQAQWMSLSALWPAYSEAAARADHAWMRKAYGKSWQATLLLFAPAVLALAAAMPWIISWWTGNSAPQLSPGLIWISAGWFLLQLAGQPPALLLNGVGRLRGVALIGTAGHVISLGAMALGGRLAGPAGVVAGMAVGFALIGLPGALIETKRAFAALPSADAR